MASSKDYPQPNPSISYLTRYIQGIAVAQRRDYHDAFLDAAVIKLNHDGKGSVLWSDEYGIFSTGNIGPVQQAN